MPISQKLLPPSDMFGHSPRPRRTPTPITMPIRKPIGSLTQTPMRTQPVALKHTQHYSSISQTHPLCKSVGPARQTAQTMSHPVPPLVVNHIRTLYWQIQHITYLNTCHLVLGRSAPPLNGFLFDSPLPTSLQDRNRFIINSTPISYLT